MSEELKPCPFCGSDAKVNYENPRYPTKWKYQAECGNYECRATGAYGASDYEASESWNTRTAVNSHKALKEALEGLKSELWAFVISSGVDYKSEQAKKGTWYKRIKAAEKALANNPKGEE